MEFVTTHLSDIIAAVTAIIAAASAIANITPSDTDNKIVAKLAKLVNLLALNFKVGAK